MLSTDEKIVFTVAAVMILTLIIFGAVNYRAFAMAFAIA